MVLNHSTVRRGRFVGAIAIVFALLLALTVFHLISSAKSADVTKTSIAELKAMPARAQTGRVFEIADARVTNIANLGRFALVTLAAPDGGHITNISTGNAGPMPDIGQTVRAVRFRTELTVSFGPLTGPVKYTKTESGWRLS